MNKDETTQGSSLEIVRLRCDMPNLTLMLDHADLLHRAFIAHHGISTPPQQFVNFLQKHISDETLFIALLVDAGLPIGYCLAFDVVDHPFIPDWQHCGYITNLFVTKERRGQGLGRKMAEAVLGWFLQRGVETVLLNVDVDMPLPKQFWQNLGFEPYLLRMKLKLLAFDNQ